MKPPALITLVAQDCRAAGGRALLVGGCVRDHLMGLPEKDWDLEVFGISPDHLRKILDKRGKVDEVGKAYGVYKLKRGAAEADVSIPRRDSRGGAGHRGIRVEGDPQMDVSEAARRRDLTVNALYFDPLAGDLIDPAGGLADLHQRVLRAVDERTFLEDPLRPLRVVQFAARLQMTPVASLISLCREAPLEELPPERIEGEWRKLLVSGVRRALGMQVARETQILQRIFPEVEEAGWPEEALERAPRLDPWTHSYAVALALWTRALSEAARTAVLDRLRIFRIEGVDFRRVVGALVAGASAPLEGRTDLQIASTNIRLDLLLAFREALEGRPYSRALAQHLGILRAPPEPWVRGRDLAALGVPKGPEMGRLVHEIYQHQLRETWDSPEEALRWARARVSTLLGG